ncbi:MAG: hypothetical protein RLZZ142_2241, partial [Verrucomicrobiota bacterium]
CFGCHGFDAKKRKAGLRLDLGEGAHGRGESGEVAVVPGRPEQSALWRRLNSADPEEVMPPPETHKRVTPAQREVLRRWIAEGAVYERHWAFEKPVRPGVPAVAGAGRAGGNPVDAFLEVARGRAGFQASAPADRGTLLRRVTYTLTGLPPTLAELDAFTRDSGADAYERVVDRLLGSERYGEQMARHWLDVARYGDTHGLHLDNERSVWPYRDWVVSAFNRNQSFRDFSIEQIAGDLLPQASLEQLTATGFLRCNVTTSEGGAIAEEYRFRYAVERASTVAQTWLGLSAGCAACHDHKYDPLSQKEFYQFYAFFNRAADPAMDGNALLTAPVVRLSSRAQGEQIEGLRHQVKEAESAFREEVARFIYRDPAEANPPIPPRETESVLVEDDFPLGAQVVAQPASGGLSWATSADGPVWSGQRALKISGNGMAQNYYNRGAAPIEVPADARLGFMLFLDPVEMPRAVMLQIHSAAGWAHRVVWGDGDAIGFGTAGTPTRAFGGALPPEGNWARMEVDASAIGLKAGDQITGVAFTLFSGTAYFDQLSLVWRVDAAQDPGQSFAAWLAPRYGRETPGLPVEINQILKRGASRVGEAERARLKEYYLTQVCVLTKPVLQPLQATWTRLKLELESLEKEIPASLVMREDPGAGESFVMERGEYNRPGERVDPDVPSILPPLPPRESGQRADRLMLAQWLFSPEHPLTARVAVNRWWQQVFGVGIVRTSGDFGSQGEPPLHPELLDWLAVEFRESGWDIKKLLRLLVTSAAFRQASEGTPEAWMRDPENRFLSRGPRFRLDGEELRDTVLAVSGLMRWTMGGRGVHPYQPPGIWEPVGFVGSNTRFYRQSKGADLYRRSLYTFVKRTAPPPILANFDAPSREQSCVRRERSNTPMQALQWMNDVQCMEAARALGERVLTEAGARLEERIDFLFRAVLARSPRSQEVELVSETYRRHVRFYRQSPELAHRLISVGESPFRSELPLPELAAWTLVSNLVLNMDEALTQH